MAKIYRINDWNENEKFSPKKIAQDVIRNNANKNSIKTSCCIDTQIIMCTKDKLLIDTTAKAHDPHMSFIQESLY